MTTIDYSKANELLEALDKSKNTKANLKAVLNRLQKNRVNTSDEIFKYLK